MAIKQPRKKVLTTTTQVESTKSFFAVQETFFSSVITSFINFLIFPNILYFHKQAWLDSNQQHTVLETVALPIGATGLENFVSKTIS